MKITHLKSTDAIKCDNPEEYNRIRFLLMNNEVGLMPFTSIVRSEPVVIYPKTNTWGHVSIAESNGHNIIPSREITDDVTPFVEKGEEHQDDGIIESRGYRYKVEEEAISWDENETPIGYCLDAEYFIPHQTTEFCNDNDCYKILASDDPELIDDGIEPLPALSPVTENNLLAEAVEIISTLFHFAPADTKASKSASEFLAKYNKQP